MIFILYMGLSMDFWSEFLIVGILRDFGWRILNFFLEVAIKLVKFFNFWFKKIKIFTFLSKICSKKVFYFYKFSLGNFYLGIFWNFYLGILFFLFSLWQRLLVHPLKVHSLLYPLIKNHQKSQERNLKNSQVKMRQNFKFFFF